MHKQWWTLAAVCVGIFMLLLDITIVNVALPSIESAFHAQLSDLQWVIDAYALSLASLMLTSGSLADLFGRRLLFGLGTAIFTLGSLTCGLATGSLFLILARAAQGVGGATMFATGLALIADAFQGRERATAFGVFGATTGVAVAVGPVLGGVITSGLGWRWIFFVNVPIGVLAIAVTLLRVNESKDPRPRRPDWLGFLAFSGSLALLVLGLIRSDADGWGSALIVGCLAGSVGLFGAFVVLELKVADPMFPFALLRKPTFSGGLIAAFTISASIFALLTYLVVYLQDIVGLSAVASGVRFLFLSGSVFAVSGLAGRATQTIPIRFIIGPGFVIAGVGLLLMRGVTTSSSWTHLVAGMIVAGVGTGLVAVPLASTAVGVVEPSQAGVASGVNSTFRQVGIATGIAALGSLLASKETSTVTAALARGPLAPDASRIAAAVASSTGDARALPSSLGRSRAVVVEAARAGYVHALNEILLVAAVIAFVGAAASLALIRQRDFHESAARAAEGG